MYIEFPLQKKCTSFGILPNPVIPVEILTVYGWQKLQFILDTGADVTMLPYHMGEMLGLHLKLCPKSVSYGIEGNGINVYAGKVKIRIGKEELLIRCLFSERNDIPYILGRADIFSVFTIVFDNQAAKIRFIKTNRVVDEDRKSGQETLYLLSIPGMRESIRKGLRTPVKKCAKELKW